MYISGKGLRYGGSKSAIAICRQNAQYANLACDHPAARAIGTVQNDPTADKDRATRCHRTYLSDTPARVGEKNGRLWSAPRSAPTKIMRADYESNRNSRRLGASETEWGFHLAYTTITFNRRARSGGAGCT
jgi:hypothetical protein